MKKVDLWKETCLILIGLIAGYLLSPNIGNIRKSEISVITDTIVVKDTIFASIIPPLTEENLRKELIKQNVLYPEIVFAQAILETNKFQSRVCKEYNNLFGLMKGDSYRKYKNWTESVTAYKKLIQHKYKEGQNYFVFLDELPYASDEEYITKLKKLI